MRILWLVIPALITSGCLSSSHRISKNELRSLTQIAPEQRGEKVRVLQSLGNSDDPPRADAVRGNTVVYVHSPLWIGGRPHHHHHKSSVNEGGGFAGGKSSGLSSNTLAKSKKEDAAALLVLAGIVTVIAATTEGARYDGWVKLHPMHPVHLIGPGGDHTVLPLAHIDQQTAEWADHAVIRDDEGPWTTLGRAPLNRQGFTLSMFLGSGEIPVLDYEADAGFVGHVQFGYFPTQILGFQLDLGTGWTEDNFNNTIYTSRTSLEVQVLPVDAGILHGGVFGQIGAASRFDDGYAFDDTSNLVGAGALMQLELTTRLAITARVGSTRSFGEWSNEIGLGVSVY